MASWYSVLLLHQDQQAMELPRVGGCVRVPVSEYCQIEVERPLTPEDSIWTSTSSRGPDHGSSEGLHPLAVGFR